MVNTLTWVLAGILAYTLLAMVLRSRGVVPEYIRFSGPITTIHTQRGKEFLDWLARPRRFWRAWGNLGIGIALVVMVGSFALVAVGAVQAIVDPQPSALNEPRNALAIPGVNDFLPLSVAPEILFGLLLGLVVHEGGHGLLCRVENIDIESMGLALLTVLPVGAFVEPDESELLEADRGAQTRMYAAGVTNNFALALVALLLLFGPIAGSIAVVDGVPVGGVLEGTPAADAGLGSGDVITAVGGERVETGQQLDAALASTNATAVTVETKDGRQMTVERSVVVQSAVQSSQLRNSETITAVNGTQVTTSAQFQRAVANRTVAALQTDQGRSVTMPIGSYVLVTDGGPLNQAGAPAGDSLVVTAIDGQRISDSQALLNTLGETSPGDEVTVTAYAEGTRQQYQVTLGSQPDQQSGILGIRALPGVSGVTVTDFGIDEYPAATFLEFLGGEAEDPAADRGLSFSQRVFGAIILPFIGVAGGFGYNFAGFTGIATNFYTVTGPLSALGTDAVFLLANALFWTGWINLVIGQFNCVPTFPLDGGHILRTVTESLVSRLPVPDRRQVTTAVTLTVTASMIGGLILMVFGPRFFA